MASSIDNSAWLEWMTTLMAGSSMAGSLMGGVSRQTYAATLPPDRYHCVLDELPLHLIPRQAVRSLFTRNKPKQPLFLNPGCTFRSDAQLPEELSDQKELFSQFAMQGMIAWVRNTPTSNPLPFWLGPQLEAVVQSLLRNEPVPATLPDGTTALLAAAGILLPEAQVGKHAGDDDLLMRARPLFREKGYAPLKDLIHPFHVAALRRYYRYLIRTGAVKLGDRQSARRYAAYKEPVARFFHHYIAPAVSAVAGQPVKPSYVYLASYLSGAELKKHTDREQCEFSVTLCLDFSPEPAMETPWPILLDTSRDERKSTVTVYQALGDGLAYRGTRLPHYRDMLSEGQTSTSIFFHYVAADFTGTLD